MSKTLMRYTAARGKCAKKYITFPIFRTSRDPLPLILNNLEWFDRCSDTHKGRVPRPCGAVPKGSRILANLSESKATNRLEVLKQALASGTLGDG